jgi:hypothetical protein
LSFYRETDKPWRGSLLGKRSVSPPNLLPLFQEALKKPEPWAFLRRGYAK